MEVIEIQEAVISERLKAVRKALKLNQTVFGQRVGISQDAISDYENGRNEPGKRTLDAIVKEYSINSGWLNTGTGEMFSKPPKTRHSVEVLESAPKYELQFAFEKQPITKGMQTKLYLQELPEKDAESYIPYYDVEITAGRIELYFDDVDEIPEGYIYAPQYRDCIACNVNGDSMYDRIFPGSRLYVYHLPNKKYIDFGQIYLVVLDGYRLLKYVHPHPSDESKIILSSYNKHYSDWSVDRVDILNLFLVKGYENQNAI